MNFSNHSQHVSHLKKEDQIKPLTIQKVTRSTSKRICDMYIEIKENSSSLRGYFLFLYMLERVIRSVEMTPASVNAAPKRIDRTIIDGGKDTSTFIVGSVDGVAEIIKSLLSQLTCPLYFRTVSQALCWKISPILRSILDKSPFESTNSIGFQLPLRTL